jgi:cellulose synthase (UDP-forming)
MSKAQSPLMDTQEHRTSYLGGNISKKLLVLNVFMASVYFLVLTFGFHPGNYLLFDMLIIGEIFHLAQIIGYCITIWNTKVTAPFSSTFLPPVDVFITVCGEPVELVRETAIAALGMTYPEHHIYLLNDGRVAKKDNWMEIDALAVELGITSITRTIPGGAKAGNINNALTLTSSPYVVVFDADHVPYSEFLEKTMGYFIDTKMGFVQTPQYYKNFELNPVTDAAWAQQALFFGPIMSGKNNYNAAFMCGTNMVLNREALNEVGGMCETNIAEDFLTSLFVHEKGWKSYYVSKTLAEGLAPEDFLSYYKQQFRWTRGSLEVIFKYNPFFRGHGLTIAQRFQYLISSSYFLSGVVVLYDALLPLAFLYFGLVAVRTSTMTLAFVFIPYIFLTLLCLQLSSNFSVTFRAISFSNSSFFIQLRGIVAVLTNQKTTFVVTSKSQIKGNFLYLVAPHMLYIAFALVGFVIAFMREGLSASLIANSAWVFISMVIFSPFIKAASPTIQLPHIRISHTRASSAHGKAR